MKKLLLLLCMGSFLFACNSDKTKDETKVDSEKKKEETTTADPGPMPDSAAMMKAWEAYMTPGAMHKMIASWDGTWEGDISMWMEPGGPEQKTKGLAVNKTIFNGLYQESTHTSTMMGMAFTGKSILGFDNHSKEFVSTWIDNLGSGIMLMKGTWDSTTNTMTLKGSYVDPSTKQECLMRETFKIVDDNTQEMVMYNTKGGKEFKTMQMVLRRKS